MPSHPIAAPSTRARIGPVAIAVLNTDSLDAFFCPGAVHVAGIVRNALTGRLRVMAGVSMAGVGRDNADKHHRGCGKAQLHADHLLWGI
jgi:hypothetical protein